MEKVTWKRWAWQSFAYIPKQSDGIGQTELVVCVEQKSSHTPLSCSTLSADLGRHWLSHANPS